MSKRKLEIDDPKLPKKRRVSSHHEGGEATVEFVSTVEEHYCQIFISVEILHRNSSGNEKTAFTGFIWSGKSGRKVPFTQGVMESQGKPGKVIKFENFCIKSQGK